MSNELGSTLRSDSAALSARLATLDWCRIERDIDTDGHALLNGLLSPDEALATAQTYDQDQHFRSRVVMARHGFGRGEYRYFRYPLPGLVAQLRCALYPPLRELANRWNERLGSDVRYPESHAAFIDRCSAAGQCRPTPLLLRYGAGDYNGLHQDIYGERLFPMQIAVLLSRPQLDFTGGEFVLTEQRPRQQSRVQVVPLQRGDAVMFAVNERPIHGTRGWYRARMRHGVSRVASGQRHTLGVIFHDAI